MDVETTLQGLPGWLSGKESSRIPMQEMLVPSLVREDHACRGATKPVGHSD